MPAYLSHIIQVRDVYKLCDKYRIFPTPISKRTIEIHSMGPDLVNSFSNFNNHQKYTKGYMINLINYIKLNKLYEDKDVLAYLYGILSHYFFDINAHPFINYLVSGCQEVGLFSPHYLIEGFLSYYLSETVEKKDFMENRAIYQPWEISRRAGKVIEDTYSEVYKSQGTFATYKKSLFGIATLEALIKSGLFSKQFLIDFAQFEKFMEINKITPEELVNVSQDKHWNPITGACSNQSFLDIYNNSIAQTLEAINVVNNYLFGRVGMTQVNKLFQYLSYDTGASGSLGNKYIYPRPKK